MTERLFTIPITCYFDHRAHEVTDENIAAGRRAGHYQALCGYRVIAAAMAAPVGRPCPECVAVLVASRPSTGPARRGRHRRAGWLWRVLRPSRVTGADGLVKAMTGTSVTVTDPFPGSRPVSSPSSRAGAPLGGGVGG